MKMEISSRSSLFILVVASLVQNNAVFGNPRTQKTRTGFLSSPEAEPPIKVLACPQNSTIAPCTCGFETSYGVSITCSGSAVNRSSIETAFRETRRVNGIPQDRGIEIYQFKVDLTQLTELDLAPFYGSQMDDLFIQNNNKLTKLVTSGNARDHGSIQVNNLDVWSSSLNKSGFGDSLKYFSNEMTSFQAENLDLNYDDYSDQDEFLPGLSAHTNLRDLTLGDCNISGRLSFDTLIPKELQNFERIDLSVNNINEIGENAFDFEGRDHGLEIDLLGNNLNETSFHPNSGIARAGRQTTLSLWFNEITTLPAPIFETFLDAHPQNSLYLPMNPLFCDERLSWLKSRREEFEPRVLADCSNDAFQSVFDSDLIP